MATADLLPNSDVTTNWDTAVPGGTHYTCIDELVSAPTDGDYIETTTLDDVDEFGMEDTPANTDEVTQVDVHIRAKIDDVSDAAYIRIELFHSAGTPVTGNPKDVSTTDLGGEGVLGNATKSWTGLTLTKAQADSLQTRVTFKSA